MKLRNFLLMALSCSALVMAEGNSNGTGGMDGQNGSMDTMSLKGTVSEFNTTDSMLIVQTENTTDTLYITSSTQLPPEQQLTQGSRVEARYVEKEGRKELVSVKVQNAQGTFYRKTLFKNTTSNGSNGTDNGSNGQSEMTVSGTIEQINFEDSTIEIKRKDNGSETIHFNQDTKMKMDQLTEGTKVQVKYKEMQDRKVATEISVKNGQNGQNGQNGKNGENGQKKSNDTRE